MARQRRSRLDRLVDLAAQLEAALEEAPVTVKAQIAAQYRNALADIAAIEPDAPAGPAVVDPEDPIAAAERRRQERLAGKG